MIDLLNPWLADPVVIDCAVAPAPQWASVARVTIATRTDGSAWLENTALASKPAGQWRVGAGLVLSDAFGEVGSAQTWEAFQYPWLPAWDWEIDWTGPSGMRWPVSREQEFTMTSDALRFRRTADDGLHHCYLLVSPQGDWADLFAGYARGWRWGGDLKMEAMVSVTYE